MFTRTVPVVYKIHSTAVLVQYKRESLFLDVCCASGGSFDRGRARADGAAADVQRERQWLERIHAAFGGADARSARCRRAGQGRRHGAQRIARHARAVLRGRARRSARRQREHYCTSQLLRDVCLPEVLVIQSPFLYKYLTSVLCNLSLR